MANTITTVTADVVEYERDLPPRRKAGDDADDAPAGQQAGGSDACDGLGGPGTQPVQQVAAGAVIGPTQRLDVGEPAMVLSRRGADDSTIVKRICCR